MARALDELVVVGVETSAPFHRWVMEEPDFRAGELSIRYVDEHGPGPDPDTHAVTVAIAAALLEEESRQARAPRISGSRGGRMSAWRGSGWPWRSR